MTTCSISNEQKPVIALKDERFFVKTDWGGVRMVSRRVCDGRWRAFTHAVVARRVVNMAVGIAEHRVDRRDRTNKGVARPVRGAVCIHHRVLAF